MQENGGSINGTYNGHTTLLINFNSNYHDYFTEFPVIKYVFIAITIFLPTIRCKARAILGRCTDADKTWNIKGLHAEAKVTISLYSVMSKLEHMTTGMLYI